MNLLKEGLLRVTAADWPSFLYDDTEIYDPMQKDKGLLRGYLLVRVSIQSIIPVPVSDFKN